MKSKEWGQISHNAGPQTSNGISRWWFNNKQNWGKNINIFTHFSLDLQNVKHFFFLKYHFQPSWKPNDCSTSTTNGPQTAIIAAMTEIEEPTLGFCLVQWLWWMDMVDAPVIFFLRGCKNHCFSLVFFLISGALMAFYKTSRVDWRRHFWHSKTERNTTHLLFLLKFQISSLGRLNT